ncbi:hypothetical protein [Cellulomonas sp. B6]|uniref:hypothetical protein n=1 Tax=Cellulomonas sp. B6 TaxID=1295626 RepID=UPI00073B7077|nr:hypothetical protein [Cellulomonas sp. B6]KSW19591.1 hypothetical protein ATM99_16265 [Cellulomonas sp. B6]
MPDLSRLDAAIVTTLRVAVARLRDSDESLALVACGMVEDLTGFFVAGAGTTWLAALPGPREDRAASAWSASEWPLTAEDPDDVAPGRVTSALWELSGTRAAIDGTGTELDDEAYTQLGRDYEDRVVAALRRLRDEGELRDAAGHELWVWLHSADDADPDLDERTFALLQDADVARDFADRYGAGGERLLARLAARSSAPRGLRP